MIALVNLRLARRIASKFFAICLRGESCANQMKGAGWSKVPTVAVGDAHAVHVVNKFSLRSFVLGLAFDCFG